MEFKQIEYFLQLAQTQHMSRTANYLHISQPTLSKSLANLEQDLGIPLFDRVGNRLQLNDNGQQFYESAKQAMKILHNAEITARQSIYEITGKISIVCLAFAPIMIPCIGEYMELNPRVSIELLQYNHRLNRKTSNNHDFILSSVFGTETLSQADDSWIPRILFSECCLIAVGPAHPLYGLLKDDHEEIELEKFRDASFVMMRPDDNYVDFTYHMCQAAGFFPKASCQTDDFLVKMSLIREGTAVALIPESCLDDAERLCPGVRTAPFRPGNRRRQLILLRKKKSLMSEAALDFWEFVLNYYRLDPDKDE